MPPDALLVLAGWALSFGLFAGLGELLSGVLLGRGAERTWSVRFWMGWGAVLVALQLWHLFLPVDARALACAAPFSFAGLLLIVRRARRPRSWNPRDAAGWALLALLFCFAARRALLAPQNGDTCSYHLQAVRWASAYPIVPGLGNLTYYLGRNTSYPLYVALLDVGPFTHRAEHLANGLLFLGVAAPALLRTLELFGPAPRRSSFLWAVAFGLSLDQLLGPNLSSPAADGAMWCLLALAGLFALEPLLDRQPMSDARLRLVLVAALLGVLVKPSGLIAAAVFGAFALASFLRSPRPRRFRALAAWGAALALVAVAPWVVRGYVVSGYPLFPATALGLQLPWRIPAGVAANDRADIESCLRYQRSDFVHGRARGPWLAGWLGHEWLDDRNFLIPAGGWALGLLALGLVSLGRRALPPLAPALLPLLAFAALWLQLFPDTRFAGPLLWFGCAVTLLCLGELSPGVPEQGRRWLALGAVLLVDAGAFIGSGPLLPLPGSFAPPPPELFEAARLQSGEPVHQIALCCYELPCAYDATRVRTRVPGDFSRGFIATDPPAPKR